jgi:DNA-binding NtrC family response regulator
MSKTILILTKDSQWRSRLSHYLPTQEHHWIFREQVDCPTDAASEHVDLVLVDVNLLPPPESTELARVHNTLSKCRFIAVYTPGTEPKLVDVRKSFIAGAQDLVEKPWTLSEMARLLRLREVVGPFSLDRKPI